MLRGADILVEACAVLAACGDESVQSPLQIESLRIPTVDISGDTLRHSVVAQGTPSVRQAHPSLAWLPGEGILVAVWTVGHGGSCGPAAVSRDKGVSWTSLEDIPEDWKLNHNCPPLYVLADPKSGHDRLVTYASRGGVMTCATSSDGYNWSPFSECPRTDAATPLINGGMPFTTVIPIRGGLELLGAANLHGTYTDPVLNTNIIAQSYSYDGGLSWTSWRTVLDMDGAYEPCEPFIIRSPDGRQLLMLIRENNHTFKSLMMTSDDEGETWSPPRRIGSELTFDRHVAKYLPDGRLIVVGRDVSQMSPAHQHLTAWVGRYEDIIKGRPGQYRICLQRSWNACANAYALGYPGLEAFPDGHFVVTNTVATGLSWSFEVVSTAFSIAETDTLVRGR